MNEKNLTSIEKGKSSGFEQNGTNVPDGNVKMTTGEISESGGDVSGAGGNIGTDVILPDSVLEKLYHSYSIKQRRAALIWFLVASILFEVWALAIPQGQSIGALGSTGVILLLNTILCALIRISGDSRTWNLLWEIAPHLIWFLAIIQLASYLILKSFVLPRDFLGWAILLNFLVYVTLPVPLVYTGILLGVGSYTIYMSALIGLAKRDPYFWEQMESNTALILAAAAVGLLYYFLGEAKQKRAFLEAKQSLEVKMVIEEQSAEQERLLLSVLPEHVAVKMRQDLGSTNSEQFKKIYMSRHENVSILYADIVGFTAISSTYSAQDLVKMLNELFARFDRLAEKYHQLRIKILGDCYYCISGAPVERPDHAALCVYMGLSMVKAIKYVQQKTNSPVDMRVGIHTGAVLAGILGQRQWQFDVYSKDVELANKMESSGMAGRVHISEKTLSFLKGEFEVESAYGEKREEALRIAGLKTYFITKVLKPFVPVGKKNGITGNVTPKKDCIENVTEIDSVEIIPDEDSKANSGDGDIKDKEKEEDFKQRLRKELVARDGHGDLSKDTTIFLVFKNDDLETAYAAYREPYSSVPLFASLLVQTVDFLYSFLILPRVCRHFTIILAPLILIYLLVAMSVAESFSSIMPEFLVKSSKRFNDIPCLRRFAAILIILLIGFTNLTDMCYFAILNSFKTDNNNSTINSTLLSTSSISSSASSSASAASFFLPLYLSNSTDTGIDPPMETLLYPSYMSNYSVLILIAIAVIAQLTHILKIFFMILFTVLHCLVNIFILEDDYVYEDNLAWNIGLPMRFNVSLILFVVAISLSFLARHMDKEDRVIFKWKTEVAEQKEKASDMRRRNEALVYNVLPVHVAEHFMKNKKRSHDDLYSQSYAEVGVLFASMPNFSDFYSEETVNNQGLECLRFLNEVISDFDALLELPQFQDIIKIKTIGSTYMAASGLNPSRQVKPDDPIIVRLAHLALLVEFALELKKALQGINEQSFNHFVLKMGINFGPITAGVIGARKPHYDIWGNTVNVASRMESTGKAGCIQVTEETCQVLQTFGYTFEQRGLVTVKGKGQLMTYYLQGKTIRPNPPSPMVSAVNTMEPLPEVEEPTESPKVKTIVSSLNDNIESEGGGGGGGGKRNDSNDGGGGGGGQRKNGENGGNQPPLKKSSTKPTNLTIKLDDTNNPEDIAPNNDPRSPRLTSPILNTLSDGLDKVEKLSNIKQNGIDNTEIDVDVDVKTPLLNLNSTNLESREFSASEKDSLISRN